MVARVNSQINTFEPMVGVLSDHESAELNKEDASLFIQDRFGFAQEDAQLLTDHIYSQSPEGVLSIYELANAFGLVGFANNMTAEELEQGTELLVNLLSTSNANDPLHDYRQILTQVPPSTELHDYTAEQIEAYNEMHKAFFELNGDDILMHHHDWHMNNGSGGTEGPGSGEDFLTMHRHMISDFEKFVNEGIP